MDIAQLLAVTVVMRRRGERGKENIYWKRNFRNLLPKKKEKTAWSIVDCRGGQKTAKLDPPDQSDRTVRPPVKIYMDGYRYGYFKYSDNGF